MSENIKTRRTMLMLIAAGMAAAVAVLLKVIVVDLPKVADSMIPVLKLMATS